MIIISSNYWMLGATRLRTLPTCLRTFDLSLPSKKPVLNLPRSFSGAANPASRHSTPSPQPLHRHLISSYIPSQLHTVATMSRPKIDVSALVKDPDSLEAKIAVILQPALDSDPTALTSEALAGDIDRLYPADYEANGGEGDVVADILWSLWGFLLKVVKKIPADDVRQQLLADALKRLQGKQRQDAKVWGQDCKMWGDLGLLGPNMREAWDMRPNFEKDDAAAIAEWTSLNSFAALLLGNSVQNWHNFAIWELRGALEEEPRSNAERDGQLSSASEWILNAGNVLRAKKGMENLDDMEKRMLKGGSKFQGETGLNDERWEFWKDRFRELSQQVEDEALKEKIEKVVEKMG